MTLPIELDPEEKGNSMSRPDDELTDDIVTRLRALADKWGREEEGGPSYGRLQVADEAADTIETMRLVLSDVNDLLNHIDDKGYMLKREWPPELRERVWSFADRIPPLLAIRSSTP